jgi:hypothetical protein
MNAMSFADSSNSSTSRAAVKGKEQYLVHECELFTVAQRSVCLDLWYFYWTIEIHHVLNDLVGYTRSKTI